MRLNSARDLPTLAVSENLFDLLSYYVSRPVLRNLGAFKK